jgi:hypothetical protein
MLNEGNQIHNFIFSSGSRTVNNYGSGSDFLTSYGPGSASQKVTGSGSSSSTLHLVTCSRCMSCKLRYDTDLEPPNGKVLHTELYEL